MFECYILSNIIISVNLFSRLCIIDVILCADLVTSIENIISRIRAQISTVSWRPRNILRICVYSLRNLTFCRPHSYLSHLCCSGVTPQTPQCGGGYSQRLHAQHTNCLLISNAYVCFRSSEVGQGPSKSNIGLREGTQFEVSPLLCCMHLCNKAR